MSDADRIRMSTMTRPSTLEAVTDAIAALGERPFIKIYIERSGSLYRWSIAHRGGPYPLLREVARYLDLPHNEVLIHATSVDGWSVVAAADEGARVDARAFIDPTSDRTRLMADFTSTLGTSSLAHD